ncbi:MAG: zinc-finger domain-containing protein [Ktedonobacteraceae bacterium]
MRMTRKSILANATAPINPLVKIYCQGCFINLQFGRKNGISRYSCKVIHRRSCYQTQMRILLAITHFYDTMTSD